MSSTYTKLIPFTDVSLSASAGFELPEQYPTSPEPTNQIHPITVTMATKRHLPDICYNPDSDSDDSHDSAMCLDDDDDDDDRRCPADTPTPVGLRPKTTTKRCKRARTVGARGQHTSRATTAEWERDVVAVTEGSRTADGERLLMRAWLTKQVAEERFAGLAWLDKEKTLLKIPWKHGSKSSWSITDDCRLFRAWAQHTGKWKANADEPKKWKANFRCALNSLPDVHEMQELVVKNGKEPHKVYQFSAEQRRPRSTKSQQSSYRQNTNATRKGRPYKSCSESSDDSSRTSVSDTSSMTSSPGYYTKNTQMTYVPPYLTTTDESNSKKLIPTVVEEWNDLLTNLPPNPDTRTTVELMPVTLNYEPQSPSAGSSSGYSSDGVPDTAEFSNMSPQAGDVIEEEAGQDFLLMLEDGTVTLDSFATEQWLFSCLDGGDLVDLEIGNELLVDTV